MVCFLASRRIVAALVFCACLFYSGGRAFASDWEVTYAYDSGADQPGTVNGLCGSNSSITKTRTVKVTATVTWKGMRDSPKRVKISEAASVSWASTLTISQNSIGVGDPPRDPNGNMDGSSGSTGLTDVITNVPNPWTNRVHCQSIAGTREAVHTVPDNGILTLPMVTLTATAKATTQDQTTGGASVNVGSYSVTVPDGKALAIAFVDIYSGDAAPNSGWTAEMVNYGEVNDGTYVRKDYELNITVSVGSGTSKEKDLHPSITYTHQDTGTTPTSFSCKMYTNAFAQVSALNAGFVAESLSEVSAPLGNTAHPDPSVAHAPNGTSLSQGSASNPSASYMFSIVTGATTSTLTVTAHLKAFASTIGQ